MDVVANNLANTTTTGFKRDEITFGEVFAREVRNDGGQGRIIGTLNSGPVADGTFTLMTRGATQMTGNPLDIAIDTVEGMFVVETPAGTRYTRDGSFTLNQAGELSTKSGYRVLDTSGRPIQMGSTGTRVSAEGVIQGPNGPQRIAIVNGTFQKEGTNLFVAIGDPTPQENSRLVPGAIESSNVDAVRSMIEMIQVQRIYEMAQRSVQQHDEASQQLIQKLISG